MVVDHGTRDSDAWARALEPRERIARPSLHEAIVARVRDMIIEGELAPGTPGS